MMINKLKAGHEWFQTYYDIRQEISGCLIRCNHFSCEYEGTRRRHPLWKRFPTHALFPMLKLGRPTRIDIQIQEKPREYISRMMRPAEDSDEEGVPQIDPVIIGKTEIPCHWHRAIVNDDRLYVIGGSGLRYVILHSIWSKNHILLFVQQNGNLVTRWEGRCSYHEDCWTEFIQILLSWVIHSWFGLLHQ